MHPRVFNCPEILEALERHILRHTRGRTTGWMLLTRVPFSLKYQRTEIRFRTLSFEQVNLRLP